MVWKKVRDDSLPPAGWSYFYESQWLNVQETRTSSRWEPEIAGIKSSRCWPMSYPSLQLATLSISLGPDFQSDSNGTTHLIFRKDLGKIFVYSCLSPAIKVAIWDQLGLYCYQSLLRHTLSILPGPDFWCRFDGALHIAIKVLCGNVHQHLGATVQLMCTMFRSDTIISFISHMSSTSFSMPVWTLQYTMGKLK